MKHWKYSVVAFSTLGFLVIGSSGFWLGGEYARRSIAAQRSGRQSEIPVAVVKHHKDARALEPHGSVIRVHTEHGVVVMPGRADDWHRAEDAFALAESVSKFESQDSSPSMAHGWDLASANER